MKGFYLLSDIDADGLVGGYGLAYCANLDCAISEIRYLAYEKCGAEYDEVRHVNRKNIHKRDLSYYTEYFNGVRCSVEMYEGEEKIRELIDYLLEILFDDEKPIIVEFEGKTYYTTDPEGFDPETSDYLDEADAKLAMMIYSLADGPHYEQEINEALEDNWVY